MGPFLNFTRKVTLEHRKIPDTLLLRICQFKIKVKGPIANFTRKLQVKLTIEHRKIPVTYVFEFITVAPVSL